MEKIIIFGGGGHAKSVIGIIKKLKAKKILGYVDHADKGRILGVSYLGSDDDLKILKKKYPSALAAIGVGSVGLTDKRQKLYKKLKAANFKFSTIVSPTAVVNQGVTFGEGTVVFDQAVINVDSAVGIGAIINTNATIDHDCTVGNFVHVCPGAIVSGGVKIGDRSFIGTGSTIIQYKTIAKDCLIAAGATVVDDLRTPGVYLGTPARLKG